LSNNKKNKSIDFDVKNISNDLGYGFKAVNGEVKKIRNNLTNVKVVLDPDGKGGYYIKTFYPY